MVWRSPVITAASKVSPVGWQLPPTDFDWCAAVAAHPDYTDSDAAQLPARVDKWLETAWIHLTTATARCLWADHVTTVGFGEHPVTTDQISAIMSRWTRRLRTLQGWVTAGPTARLDRLIIRCVARHCSDHDDAVPRLRLSFDRYLLFFDGGSRGNPGPGGSGSVIVRVRAHFDLVWVAAMSFASPKTTNNFAEFQGLIAGLRAAVNNYWHPLTVIGDSNMILTLMRNKKPPKARSLQPLYHQARQAAASLRVTGWHHHYRAQNKMADKAANVAMDARRSFQALAQDLRPELALVRAHLDNDAAPWIDRLLYSSLSPRAPPALASGLDRMEFERSVVPAVRPLSLRFGLPASRSRVADGLTGSFNCN